MLNFALTEYAVLWPALPDAASDNYGQLRVGKAREIRVRWEYGSSADRGAATEATSNFATVDVDCEIIVGSILRLGRLSALPARLNNLYRVFNYNEVKGITDQDSVSRYVEAVKTNVMPSAV